jgi:hypothetical protein
MEMLLKKEIGTAKAILAEILLRYRLSGNSHPGLPKTLAQTWHKTKNVARLYHVILEKP